MKLTNKHTAMIKTAADKRVVKQSPTYDYTQGQAKQDAWNASHQTINNFGNTLGAVGGAVEQGLRIPGLSNAMGNYLGKNYVDPLARGSHPEMYGTDGYYKGKTDDAISDSAFAQQQWEQHQQQMQQAQQQGQVIPTAAQLGIAGGIGDYANKQYRASAAKPQVDTRTGGAVGGAARYLQRQQAAPSKQNTFKQETQMDRENKPLINPGLQAAPSNVGGNIERFHSQAPAKPNMGGFRSAVSNGEESGETVYSSYVPDKRG